MKTFAKWVGEKFNESHVNTYSIGFDADVEMLGMKLIGSLALPREKWHHVFTNFHLGLREYCEKLLSEFRISYEAEGSTWEFSFDTLSDLIMNAIVDTIQGINEKDRDLFHVAINWSKWDYKKFLKTKDYQTLSSLYKENEELEAEILKAQAENKALREVRDRLNVPEPVIQQQQPIQETPAPTTNTPWPVFTPKKQVAASPEIKDRNAFFNTKWTDNLFPSDLWWR